MPADDDALFGQIAVEKGLLTDAQVAEGLDNQKAMAEMGISKPLGEVLLAKGYLDRDAVRLVTREAMGRSGRRVKIGSYEIVAKLGQGGMGAVYRAEVPATGATVAVKVLPPELGRNPEFVERFRREAEIATSLDHPNIVRAIDAGESAGYHYFAMEFVEGESVHQRLKREGSIPEGEALRIVRHVAMALQHAAGAGLVHRDVKPDNIFLAPDGHAKLGDLGLARRAGAEGTQLTQAGLMIGTPHYVSPEQARGEADIDSRSDIYSLGATLYHMITGQVPFDGDTSMAVLNKHLHEELRWPADINDALTDEVCLLISKMMAKDRNDRYQEALELIAEIDRVIRGDSPAMAELAVGRSSVRQAVTKRDPAEASKRRRRRLEADSHRTKSRPPVRSRRTSLRMAPARKRNNAPLIAGAVGATMLVTAVLVIALGWPDETPPAVRRPPRPRRPRPPVARPDVPDVPAVAPSRPTPPPSRPQPRPAPVAVPRPVPVAGRTLLVDWGGSPETNVYGTEWKTVVHDHYTEYSAAGPKGTNGSHTGKYNYQSIGGGRRRTFTPGQRIVVTWYNNHNKTISITPYISFDDPDRRLSMTVGTWHEMTPLTIRVGGTGTTTYTITAESAGKHPLISIASNRNDPSDELICDKIELVTGVSPVGGSRGTVLYRADWNDGVAAEWAGGTVVDAPGRGKVLSATHRFESWGSIQMSSHWRQEIPVTRDAWLSFWYYQEKPDPMMRLVMKNSNAGRCGFDVRLRGKYALKTGEWSFFAIPLMEFADGSKNFADGDKGTQLMFLTSTRARSKLMIDDMRITRGGPPPSPAK